MSDFGKRLREQKSAIENDQAAEEARLAAERAQKEAEIKEQISFLEKHLAPILNSCRRELEAEGMALTVKEAFDVVGYMVPRPPSVDIVCGAPSRRSDGYRLQGRPLYVAVDGDKFRLGIKEQYSTTAPKTLTTASVDELAKKVEEMILSLAAEILKEWKASPASHL